MTPLEPCQPLSDYFRSVHHMLPSLRFILCRVDTPVKVKILCRRIAPCDHPTASGKSSD
jgi:hypothetical protein